MNRLHLPIILVFLLLPAFAAAEPTPPDGWGVMTVPGNWLRNYCLKEQKPNGFAWYRYLVEVPAEWRDKELFLELTYLDDCDEAFFNGTRVGGTGKFPPNYESGYGPHRSYAVPAELVRPGKANLIAVRVYDDGGGNTSFTYSPRLKCGEESIDLGGYWQFRFGDDAAWARWGFDPDESAKPDDPRAVALLESFQTASANPAGTMAAQAGMPDGRLMLWYRQPAAQFSEALPLGNGRLGCMVFGGIRDERLALNDDTLWSGGPRADADRPEAYKHLAEIQKLLDEGKYAEAEVLCNEFMTNQGGGYDGAFSASYQALGDLNLRFDVDPNAVEDYFRTLDLETATATVRYRVGDVKYTREIFTSPVDDVLVMRVVSDPPGHVSFSARLAREADAQSRFIDPDRIIMQGRCDGGAGMKFEAQLRVLNRGGRRLGFRDALAVHDADEAVLLLAAGTDYRGKDPFATCQAVIARATEKPLDALRKDHVAEHRRLFDRVDLDLDWNVAVVEPIDVRLRRLRHDRPDPHLLALFFQYGRYLLISSSRPGTMPANRQGLWAEGLKPPWNADYATNVHLQMNYWPAEVCNLAECHQPLFDLIEKLRGPGSKTAKAYYNAPGWVCHSITNAWGWTSPGAEVRWGLFPTGGAWLCRHLWDHYDFSGDQAFLRRVYPTMKQSCEFLLGCMIERNGRLVTSPSVSPQNVFRYGDRQTASVSIGASVDRQIVWDLFSNTIAASEALNTDEAFRKQLEDALGKIELPGGSRWNFLKEWREDFEPEWPFHRYQSHLFALCPGRQITPRGNRDWVDRCKETLRQRLEAGGGQAGFSRAWITNCYARLEDRDLTYRQLVQLLREFTLPNLMGDGPPMQFDANLGGTAAIAEMLLQSHAGEIRLMPAWSYDWHHGHVRGLRARGGLEVDMVWRRGTIRSATLAARIDGKHKVRLPDDTTLAKTEIGGEEVELKKEGDGTYTIELKAGQRCVLTFQ